MKSKTFLFLALTAIASGAFFGWNAHAGVKEDDAGRAYDGLHSVELREAKQPKLNKGFERLAQNESRFSEDLPMQLEGAIKVVKSRKYLPAKRSKHL